MENKLLPPQQWEWGGLGIVRGPSHKVTQPASSECFVLKQQVDVAHHHQSCHWFDRYLLGQRRAVRPRHKREYLSNWEPKYVC